VKDLSKHQKLVEKKANVQWREKSVAVGTLTLPRQACTENGVSVQLQTSLSKLLDLHPDDVHKAFAFHIVHTHEENRPTGEIQAFRADFYYRHAVERFATIHQKSVRTLQEGKFAATAKRVPFDDLQAAGVFGAEVES